MKYFASIAFAAAAASALSIGIKHEAGTADDQNVVSEDLYLVELNPGETRWVTLDEKWELRRNGQNFMDITATGETYPVNALNERATVKYPSQPAHSKTVKKLAKSLSKDNMHSNLKTFSSFHTRYYLSHYGTESAEWLRKQIAKTISDSDAVNHGATVSEFKHTWNQPSLIARIPGKTNRTVVVGAHQDSINLFFPSLLAAPGADDDGSGTVTILEALRVLLMSEEIAKGQAENTLEFHWYSAEEGGLLGSGAVWTSYASESRDVKAMLQQDMTGYTERTIKAGKPESVGIITDFVSPALTDFIKTVVTTYCDIPYVLTKCGYACSDHASANKAGYPSAFVIESDMSFDNPKIHTTEDKIEYLSFDHMLQHAKMTLGFAYELAMAKFD